MILLHAAVVGLYALAAWALWPQPAPEATGVRTPAALRSWATFLLPAAILLHAWLAGREFATPGGLDLSLPHAVSIIAEIGRAHV